MRLAGRDVKSKAARKEAEVEEVEAALASGSSFGRFASEGWSLDVDDDGRFLLSIIAALRFFSSALALSMRTPCCASASLIWGTYGALFGILCGVLAEANSR